MTQYKAVLRYPGSKWRLARWIVSQLPPHRVYLEPYFGSGAVLFAKPRSEVETVNDLDGRVVTLFRVLRDSPEALSALVAATPWARDEYEASYAEPTGDDLEDARRFLVRCWQSHGSRLARNAGWRCNVRRNRQRVGVLWRKIPGRLAAAANRLQGVQIENAPAVTLMRRYSDPDTLIYADPPYPISTRVGGRLYAHEMDDAAHADMLAALGEHPGPVVLSGYDCALYRARLSDWSHVSARALADSSESRTEVLWLNEAATRQTRLAL